MQAAGEPGRDRHDEVDESAPVEPVPLRPGIGGAPPAGAVTATGGAPGMGGTPGVGGVLPAPRASDRDRDSVVQRLQEAFADGRLDDVEFDERSRAALIAKTHVELDVLLADLPAEGPSGGRDALQAGNAPAGVVAPAQGSPRPEPGKYAIGYKSAVRRAGRWSVPEKYTTIVYKGSGWLDLRAAELTAQVTTLETIAYKSRVTILVPPTVRVEATGSGIVQYADDEDPGHRLPPDAPVVHIHAMAYKGTVEVSTRPPEHSDSPDRLDRRDRYGRRALGHERRALRDR